MSKLQSKLAGAALTSWVSKNGLLVACAFSIYVSLFAARFKISRLFPGISPEWHVLGELRTWAMLAATILLAIGWSLRNPAERPVYLRDVWKGAGLVALAQLALVTHAVFYSPEGHVFYFVWELLSIAFVAGILAFAFQIWGLRFVKALMWIALGFSISLAAWMTWVLLDVKLRGSSPLATTFTFYRIQIFGGFVALILLFRPSPVVVRWLIGICAMLGFTAAYLSLSKAALLAGTGGLLFLAAIYITWFETKRAAAVVAVSVTAIIVFLAVSGGMFAARVTEGLLGTGYALSTGGVAPPTAEEVGGPPATARAPLERAIADFEAQRKLASVVACTAGKYACSFKVERWEQDIADTMLRFRVYIPDFSFRIRLLMHGLGGVSKAPWLGNGFGNFLAVATNLYTATPEPYSHPHNIVVELLYSVGVVGTLFVGGVFLILVWEILRANQKIHTSLPLVAFVFSVCIGSIFGGDYLDFRLAWIGLLLCVMLRDVDSRKPSRGGEHEAI